MEVVADIKFSQVPALVVQLEKTYDVKEVAMRAAIEHRGSFRLVHHDTLQKIDVALPAYRAYSQVRQEKAQRHALEPGSRAFYVASPEDTHPHIVGTLQWGCATFPSSLGGHRGDTCSTRKHA